MRAATLHHGEIELADIPDPLPGPGQVLVRTLSCGICGSDLHLADHAVELVETSRRSGGTFELDPAKPILLGHEYCAEVLAYGPDTEAVLPIGSRVCSLPVLLQPEGPITIGFSNEHPGGYGERFLLEAALMVPVPDGLSSDLAALTEPVAVGVHAVALGAVTGDEVALVVGCGPIGLAVIAALRRQGARSIVATDLSAARRAIAAKLGADRVVDPKAESPYAALEAAATYPEGEAPPPETPFAAALPALRPTVIFECVGVPGLLRQVMEGAPRHCRIVVVGVCMPPDEIEPLVGINKELSLQFVLGYTPEEFAQTLADLASGDLRVEAMITAKVGLEGVATAFEELRRADRHCKILVDPTLG